MMRKHLVISTFLCTSLSTTLLADDAEAEDIVKPEGNVLPALKVLPAGSILSGVRIPRYNKDYTPASMLTADQLKVISKRQIQGSSVDLKMYDDEGTIKASTHLNSIYYDQATELITSEETFVFSAAQFKTTSQGLILDWKNSRGFFLGKNHTIVYLKESAPMKDKKNTGKSQPTKALGVLAAVTMATTPNALSAPTPEELAEIDRLSKPSTEMIEQINTQVAIDSQAAEKTTAEIDQAKAALETTIKESNPNILKKEPQKEDSPLSILTELKPEAGKDHIDIQSEGVMFFDAKLGMMVFSKNTKMIHPDYKFSCAGEVKVKLAEKIQKKKLTKEELEALKPNDRYGDISQIIATDNVVLVGKDKEGNPMTAVAGMLVYDHASGVITLRGLNSRVTLPNYQLKIIKKDGFIKIDREGNLSNQGASFKANLEKLKNKGN